MRFSTVLRFAYLVRCLSELGRGPHPHTFVGLLADALDTISTSMAPEKIPDHMHSSDVDELSDDAFHTLFRTVLRLHYPDYSMFKLTTTTVLRPKLFTLFFLG